jgi:hypothetical protein
MRFQGKPRTETTGKNYVVEGDADAIEADIKRTNFVSGGKNFELIYMFVEGTSPSTHIRSRFPFHPSLSAVDGASIEGKK